MRQIFCGRTCSAGAEATWVVVCCPTALLHGQCRDFSVQLTNSSCTERAHAGATHHSYRVALIWCNDRRKLRAVYVQFLGHVGVWETSHSRGMHRGVSVCFFCYAPGAMVRAECAACKGQCLGHLSRRNQTKAMHAVVMGAVVCHHDHPVAFPELKVSGRDDPHPVLCMTP